MFNEQRAMTENAIARVAIITGAAGGLGSSVARLLASSGHDLALVDIKGDELSKLASEVAGLGVRCHSVAADLAQDAECRKVIEQTLSTLGKVDILVNAAALLGRTPLEDVTDMAFSKIFNVNCKAVFLLARDAMKDMEKRQWGRVVNVTSIGVYEGGANMTSALYEASKGAVAVFTKMFAKFGAPRGILVNTVCPGAMRTGMILNETPPEIVKAYEARIPLGRLANPQEVANAVVFLTGDHCSYLTGSTIDVNGGLVMP